MNPESSEITKLIALIDNLGIVKPEKGFAIPKLGIFSESREAFIAGIDENGIVVAADVDQNNSVLNFQHNKTGWKVGTKISDSFLHFLKMIRN